MTLASLQERDLISTMDPQLQRFYRQYIQQFSHLAFPHGELLKQDDIQRSLEQHFFTEANSSNMAVSYQIRTLDKIIQAIEDAVKDPEEEGVSDFLYQHRVVLALKQSNGLPALERSKSIYTAPQAVDAPAIQVVINEAKNIIGAGPTTGLRTWEASLRLAHYLFQHQRLIRNQKVLELGAGTGFLSLFCSLALGAKSVIATDGADQVLDGLRENLSLNAAPFETNDEHSRPMVRKLRWEDTESLDAALTTDDGDSLIPDIILGADVTYHSDAHPPLAKLLAKISRTNPAARILISHTDRNSETLDNFCTMCRKEEPNFEIEEVDFHCPVEQQKGLFYSLAMPIRIFNIASASTSNDSRP